MGLGTAPAGSAGRQGPGAGCPGTVAAFEAFQAASPTIVCNPAVRARVYRYVLPPATELEQQQQICVMYFSPHVARMSARSLADLVAHEAAHVVLGRTGRGSVTEREADDLAETWGFRRGYARARRRQLEAQERR
jgi:hypothetical protein